MLTFRSANSFGHKYAEQQWHSASAVASKSHNGKVHRIEEKELCSETTYQKVKTIQNLRSTSCDNRVLSAVACNAGEDDGRFQRHGV